MKRILVVDDHADIRRLIRMTLEFEDFEIHEASSGQACLELAATVQPDLILLDVMMPGAIDGLEACRQIKQGPLSQSCRIVMLSARGMATDHARGREAGADAYLVKPFSPLQLIQVMQDMLAEGAGAAR